MYSKFKVGKTYREVNGMWDVSWVVAERRTTITRNGHRVVTLVLVPPVNASKYRKQQGNHRARVRLSDPRESCKGMFYGTIAA